MKSSPCAVSMALALVAILVMFQVYTVSGATVPTLEEDPQANGSWRSRPSEAQIMEEIQRQLFMLQAAQESLVSKIYEMKLRNRDRDIPPKRSHYANMCMFNVVACYRK